MPPKQSRKRAASNEYEADGGFVEDAPKNKKTKASAGEAKGGAKKSDNGNEFWELGRTRRVQLNEFKGKHLVDIREYYEKDEQMLPGKKGISLNIDQLTSFIEQLPELEAALKKKGIDIPRPAYDGKAADIDQDDEVEEKADAGDSEDEENVKSKAGRLDKFKHKANHEATSDEDN